MNDLLEPPKRYSEQQLTALIHAKYEGEAFARLAQVRNATGFNSTTRTADAMVMSLWPSRGIWLSGFEVKSSRSDWLSELKKPAKAEEIGRWCHYWWLVAANEDVVRGDELPEAWGLMVPDKSGKKLQVVKEAPKKNPQSIGFEFLASIFRNITNGMVPKASMADEIKRQVESRQEGIYERAKREEERKAERSMREYDALRSAVDAFETNTGLKLPLAHTWSWNRDGTKALRFMLSGGFDKAKRDLAELEAKASQIASSIREQLTIAPPEPDFSI